MKKLEFSILLILPFIAVQAADLSQKALRNQLRSQVHCVQQRMPACLIKLCPSNDKKKCRRICKKTIKNECRYAGE